MRVRRPSLKKRLAEASDDEDIPRRVKKPKARKRAKTESTEVTPTPTPEEEHVDIDGDVDMDTPVDVEGGARSRKATPSEPSLPSLPTISSKKDKLAVDAKAAASGKRVAKKRQIVWSDDEDDEPSPTSQSKPTIDDEDGEDGFEPANHAAPPAKKNGTTSAKNGKGLVSVKAAKRKNTKDDKPILMKDESKPRLLAAAVPTDETASVNTPATSSQAASSSKLESESADGGNVPLEEVKPAPAVLPKRKLPTIKKNKPTVSAPSTGTSTPTLPKPINPILPKTALSANPSAPPQRKPTLPPANNKELDLFNSGVYAELFGKVCVDIYDIRRDVLKSVSGWSICTAFGCKPAGKRRATQGVGAHARHRSRCSRG